VRRWPISKGISSTGMHLIKRLTLKYDTPRQYLKFVGGTAAAASPPLRPGNPALCGSRPLVTPYYCRLGDLLCFVFMSANCMFYLSVCYVYLQYFDTVGWVFQPLETVSHITYTVLVGT